MRLRLVLGSIVVVTYAVAAFYTATHARQTPLAVLLAMGPLLLATLLLVRKAFGLAALAIVAAGLAWLIHHFIADLQAHITTTYYLQHVGMLLCGALLFGLSLIPPRVPLCTRFASFAHNVMSPELKQYTRTVTVAWAVFFAVMAILSSVLFFSSLPFYVWTAFEAFLTLPMVGLMFAAEYMVRRRVLPHEQDQGITGAWHAYQAYRAHHAGNPKK